MCDSHLEVYTGCVRSGKSSKLFSKICYYRDIGYKCLVINHKNDNRDVKNGVSSHSSLFKGLPDDIKIESTDDLSSIDISPYDTIAVDEANFFNGLKNVIVNMWLPKGKTIIIFGIDRDFLGREFGEIKELLPYCDIFKKLMATCLQCKKEGKINKSNPFNASFSMRISGGKNLIEIGSTNYEPACRYHFYKHLQKMERNDFLNEIEEHIDESP